MVLLGMVTGLDRSGKSTQCARLVARIESAGKPVKSLKFPGKCFLLKHSARATDASIYDIQIGQQRLVK
jgi:thymidylate kinase